MVSEQLPILIFTYRGPAIKAKPFSFLGNCKFDQKIMLLFWLAPLKLQSLLRWGYHGFHYS